MIQEIIDAIRTVAEFNESIEGLAEQFEAAAPDAIRVRGAVADAVGAGSGVYAALDRESPALATAIHSFVYQIAYPLQSITTRDEGCEKVAKAILKL